MKILKRAYELIIEIENAKNDLISAVLFMDLKKFIVDSMKYNRPDILVCDSCQKKGGAKICYDCNRGNLFESPVTEGNDG